MATSFQETSCKNVYFDKQPFFENNEENLNARAAE